MRFDKPAAQAAQDGDAAVKPVDDEIFLDAGAEVFGSFLDVIALAVFATAADYLKNEIAPSVPFVQVVPESGDVPAEWNWINDPPSSGMRAAILAQELAKRGYITEPFDRLHSALRMVYPHASWKDLQESEPIADEEVEEGDLDWKE